LRLACDRARVAGGGAVFRIVVLAALVFLDAELIITGGDIIPLKVDPMTIKDIRVVATMKEGMAVFKRSAAP
jgi:hypothetical protein